MRYVRKLQNTNPEARGYPTISIPAELSDIFFKTDTAIIEALPDGRGVTVKPAKVEPLV